MAWTQVVSSPVQRRNLDPKAVWNITESWPPQVSASNLSGPKVYCCRCVHLCGGWRSTGVFVHCSPLKFLRQGRVESRACQFDYLVSQLVSDPLPVPPNSWGSQVCIYTYLAFMWVLSIWTPGLMLDSAALTNTFGLVLPSPLLCSRTIWKQVALHPDRLVCFLNWRVLLPHLVYLQSQEINITKTLDNLQAWFTFLLTQ